MSEVTGIRQINNLLSPTMRTNRREDAERLEALLRNRQELVEIIESIEELDAAGFDAPDDLAALFAKAKELDNE